MSKYDFYKKRMEQLGIEVKQDEKGKEIIDDKNLFRVSNPDWEHPQPKVYDAKIFSEDKEGNIEILYWRLNRDLISYTAMGDGKMSHVNGKIRHYLTKRLREPKDGYKYKNPKGQGAPAWYPPELIEAYEKEEQIDTLFLTEGVFKAFLATKWGLKVIGLSSISTYRDPKTNTLHPEIIEIIETCQVQNVVVLWDGDCRDISEKALLKREDLFNRPAGFYGAAKAIKNLIEKIKFKKTREHPKVYFYHCRPESMEGKPKGIDDMLIAAKDDKERLSIIKEASRLNDKSMFFYKKNITKGTASLFKYFGLKNYQDFYNLHLEKIELTEFMFKGDIVRWDDTQEELIMMAPAYAKEIRWIGDEFFKDIIVPGAKSDRRKLDKRTKTTLVDLHGKNFLKFLEYYEGFCNVPNHLNYEQVIERYGKKYYNRYFPFPHKGEQGQCNTIIDFYKHIFGEEEVEHEGTNEKIPNYELGLDYTQILLMNPTQNLPVVILYSPENATGKSTFGNFHQKLFTDNVIQISNSDLQSDFNETYSDKLLAICEETLLERRKDAERIKAISTSEQVLVNPKGQRQYSIDFFCKFMLYSNNLRMIYANRHDERYWMMQVYPAKKRNPNLLEDMTREIPAFINFLQNRKLKTKQEGRMHFHPSLTKTRLFDEVVQVNEPGGASDIRDGVTEMFLQEPEMKTISMTLGDIKGEFLPASSTDRWIREILKDHLRVDLERNIGGQAISRRGSYVKYERTSDGIERKEISTRGRHYMFSREQFVEDEVDMSSYDIDAKEEKRLLQAKMKFNPSAEKGEDLPF